MLTVLFHLTSHFSEYKTLVSGGKDCELDPENSELVGGQIMRYSESEGWKIGLVCERIKLTTTVIKFQRQ